MIATPEQYQEITALHNEWTLTRDGILPNLLNPNALNTPSRPTPYDGPTIAIAGAYQGKLCQLFLELYNPTLVTGFEPARWAYLAAKERLAPYPAHQVHLHPFGIGDHTEANLPMGDFNTDAQSFMPSSLNVREQGTGTLLAAEPCLKLASPPSQKTPTALYPPPIDLLVINMEGYEYVLLPHLLSSPLGQLSLLTQYVSSVAIQFHTHYQPSSLSHQLILSLLDEQYPHSVHDYLPSWGLWYM